MPHYYFHLYNSLVAIDEEGQDLPGLDEAKDFAVKGARELASEEVLRGAINFSHRIDIADAAGTVVATVTYADAVKLER